MANKRTELVLHQGGARSNDGPDDADGQGAPKRSNRKSRRAAAKGKTRDAEPVVVPLDGPQTHLARPTGPVACAECHGPIFLCQGRHAPEEGASGPEVQRVVTALRAAYLGLLLTPVAPTEQIGGTLLLAARASLLGADGRSLGIASLLADPESSSVGALDAARMVIDTLGPDPIDERAGNKLWRLLRNAKADYLQDAVRLVFRSATSSPITERGSFDLIALVCDDCAPRVREADRDWDRLAAATTFDGAVACPLCHVEHAHPWRQFRRRIHPVSRCWGSDETGCCVHGGEMKLGLCDKGRAMYEGAFAKVGATRLVGATGSSPHAFNAEGREIREPWEQRLVEALLRAKKREDLDAVSADLHKVAPFMETLGRTINTWVEKTLGVTSTDTNLLAPKRRSSAREGRPPH